jgi:hypothetical protein
MSRLTYRQYQRRTLFAITLYTVFMLSVWPIVHTVGSLPLKILLALAPLIPMFYVLAQLARLIRDSDELEQRTHLIALGVATGVTAALSLLGGFLSIAQVLPLDGSVLIWVFPLMMASYGITRWYVARAYGHDVACAGESGLAPAGRLLLLALITGVAALYAWRHDWDSFRTGLLCGMAGASAVLGLLLGMARWRSRGLPDE